MYTYSIVFSDTGGSDFNVAGSPLTLSGVLAQPGTSCLSVTIVDDQEFESTEDFIIEMQASTVFTLSTDSNRTRIFIIDDELRMYRN